MAWLYFISVYGFIVGMIVFAWAMEPKKTNTNSGVRL